MRYVTDVREIALWRWVFGLALPLAALLARHVDSPDAGFLALALSFVGAYPLGLLIVFVLSGIAMWALVLALDARDFLFRLPGLRD